MNIKVRTKNEPILFITKEYNLESQDIMKKNRGESGMCVDFYLYYFSMFPAQILVRSSESYKLYNKEYFTGKLKDLNTISLSIIINYLNNNNIFPKNPTGSDDIDSLTNIIKVLNQKENNDYGDARDIVYA